MDAASQVTAPKPQACSSAGAQWPISSVRFAGITSTVAELHIPPPRLSPQAYPIAHPKSPQAYHDVDSQCQCSNYTSPHKGAYSGNPIVRCGRDKCPMHILNGGSFNEAGFEIDHWTKYSVGYRNVGELSAMCHACHALKSRMERISLAEEGGDNTEEVDE